MALAQVLRPLAGMFRIQDHPDLLVGLDTGDDAAVYRLTADQAIVQTIDFFTPVVDDPYDYGAIAAANAMSDVYAMGGEVLMALNVCGFPAELPNEVVAEIIRGGAAKVAEAGAVLAGGHTVDAKEPLYGLAVTGLVHPDKLWTKAGARPGDRLVLTKPLGVGVVTTALKRQQAAAAHVQEATASMRRLNRGAAAVLREFEPHACTDITGFALLGHALEVAEHSGVCLEFWLEHLPFVAGAREYALAQCFPGGACNNQEAYASRVTFAEPISEAVRMLLFTPETSGGLLAAVPAESLEPLLVKFGTVGEVAWVVGQVVAGEGILVS